MNTSSPHPTPTRRDALRALLGSAATCVVGCGRAPEATGGPKQFVVSLQTMNNPFFIELAEGLEKVISGRGDRLLSLDSRHDSHKQRNDLSDAVRQRPAAIFLNPVNWEGVRGSLLDAKRAGVPVVVVDTAVSDVGLVLCQVASDNVAAGRLAAEALAKVKPAAKVVILNHSVAKACIERVAGFREVAAKFPEMTILDEQEGHGTTEGARPVMRDLLGRFPELDAAFPINDPSALGCASAIEAAGRTGQVAVVTVDGSAEGIAAVRAGKLLATVAQSPTEIGRVAAEAAYSHLAGKPVEKDVKIAVKLITRETADEPAGG